MISARTIARDPNTPPEELERLAASDEFAKDVASNPNTPIDILLQLGDRYPREVVTNPSFELALITGETNLRRMNHDAVSAMVSQPEAPEALLTLASDLSSNIIDAALLYNPATPRPALNTLAKRDPDTAAHHVNAEPQPLGHVDDLIAASLKGIKAFPQPTEPLLQALRPLLPAATAQALAQAEAPEARLYAATNEHLEPDTLRELTQSPNFEVVYGALRNPSTPPDALEEALESDHIGKLMATSVNPNLPREALAALLGHHEPTIAAAALKNPQLTADELRAATTDDAPLAHLVSIGENPRAPQDLLERLATNDNPVVRAAVARNPNTPAPLRATLAEDPAYLPRAAAELNPTAASINLTNADNVIDAITALQQAAPVLAATLHHLPIMDPVQTSRIARHLTTSHDPAARLCLAANPATPRTVLKHLATADADQRVRHAAQQALEAAAC